MNLPIIQSIIHGELRPNIVEKYNFRDVSNAMNVLPEKLSDVERLFISKFPEIEFDFESDHPFPFNCVVTEVYTPLNEGSLSKHFELPIPKWTTPKEKFYQIIVDAEIHRIKLAIVDYALKDRSDITTRTTVKDTLRQIVTYSKKVDASVSAIFAALRIKLICAYVEIAAIASPILAVNKDFLSFEDLMFEVLKRYPNDDESAIYNDYIESIKDEEPVFAKSVSQLPSQQEFKAEIIATTFELFVKEVEKYRFAELEKVKCLNERQQVHLIRMIVESPVGYSVVMLKHIGYFDKLKKEFNMNKEQMFKHIGVALKKSPRIVKGNYNVLKPNSKEDASVYNSQIYVQQVEEDYENLLL